MAKNKSNFISIIRNIAESLGIDEIPYAVGRTEFKTSPPFQPTKFKEIQEKVDSINGVKIDDALVYCKEILAAENDRGDKIENKAYNLIGVTGISTAFVTGITSLFSNRMQPWLFWLIIVIYFFIVLSLTLTVLLAFRVVKVGGYKYGYPNISVVFDMGSRDLEKIKKERLAFYLDCYAKNFQIHNIKASYLIGSQIWFRNAVVLFLILALTLVFNLQKDINYPTTSPIGVPNLTPPISPMNLTISPQTTLIVTNTLVQMRSNTPTFKSTINNLTPTIQPLSIAGRSLPGIVGGCLPT